MGIKYFVFPELLIVLCIGVMSCFFFFFFCFLVSHPQFLCARAAKIG